MNKGVIFAAGALIGAAAGSVITYFAVRNHFDEAAADAIEKYAEYAEEKIQKALDSLHDDFVDDGDEEEDPDDDTVRAVKDNRVWSEDDEESIKKYHHYIPEQQSVSANGIFEKGKENKVTEGEKALKKTPERRDDPNIREIDEVEANNYEAIPLTYLYPQDELYWGYDTDTRELAESHFGRDREEIIGQLWRWATDYTDGETGVGYTYVKNDKMGLVFSIEIVVDLDLEEDE